MQRFIKHFQCVLWNWNSGDQNIIDWTLMKKGEDFWHEFISKNRFFYGFCCQISINKNAELYFVRLYCVQSADAMRCDEM